MKTMCGGLFSFCFLHETVFGNGQIAITHNEQRYEKLGIKRDKLSHRTNDN